MIANYKTSICTLSMGILLISLGLDRVVSQPEQQNSSKVTVASELQNELQKCTNSDPNRLAQYAQLDQRLQNKNTYLFFCSAQEYVGGGKFKIFTPYDGEFSAKKDSSNEIRINFEGSKSGYWTANLSAPEGKKLLPGIYREAERAAFHSPKKPGLSFSGNGKGCNKSIGTFAIHMLEYQANGEVGILEASFLQYCSANPSNVSPLIGGIRYQASGFFPSSQGQEECTLTLSDGSVMRSELLCQPQ